MGTLKIEEGRRMDIYAHWVSQPSRAVMWCCLMANTKFNLIETDPMSGQTRTEEFLKLNPAGTIPTLVDKQADLALFESHAILTYLAEKYQWKSLYPESPTTRAKIQQYLHWHHLNTRFFTIRLFRPVFLACIKKGDIKTALEKGQKGISKPMAILEHWLSNDEFLCGTKSPSIADIACYCEIDQLSILGLFDFGPYPHVSAWMKKIEALPHYNESHQALQQLSGFFSKRMASL